MFFNISLLFLIIILTGFNSLHAQKAMMNVDARKLISLNGTWDVILDPAGVGEWRQIWLEKKPEKKTDFIEYSFRRRSFITGSR